LAAQPAALAQAFLMQQPMTLGQLAQWQQRYALPNWQQMLTRLSPQQEAQFETWARQNRAPITDDYDMRGFWLHRSDPNNRTAINPNDHMLHFPDTYKTPLHQSFSGESIYANPASHPPMWNDKDQLVAPDGTVLFDERAKRRR
jgi:hypothetical protein